MCLRGVTYGTQKKQRLPQAASLSYEEDDDMPDIWDELKQTIDNYNKWHEHMVQINDPDNARKQD